MKVFLLQTEDGRRLFYAPAPEPRHAPPQRSGVRGWLERKAHGLRDTWQHAEHGLVGRLHRVWHTLHQRCVPVDESMLVHLRSTPVVEVHHPTTVASGEVRDLWTRYLADRRRSHLPWLAVNSLISPATVLLAPLPGPNLVGYWFAYRAVRHLFALAGLRHAAGPGVETTFHPDPALDRTFACEISGNVPLPDFADDPAHLGEFLRRGGRRPAVAECQEAAGRA